jgi:glutaredoxin
MVILYTTHCPKCKVIEKKLAAKGIEYTEVDDKQKMIDMGFKSIPVLEVDGKRYNFGEANKFLMNYGKEE